MNNRNPSIYEAFEITKLWNQYAPASKFKLFDNERVMIIKTVDNLEAILKLSQKAKRNLNHMFHSIYRVGSSLAKSDGKKNYYFILPLDKYEANRAAYETYNIVPQPITTDKINFLHEELQDINERNNSLSLYNGLLEYAKAIRNLSPIAFNLPSIPPANFLQVEQSPQPQPTFQLQSTFSSQDIPPYYTSTIMTQRLPNQITQKDIEGLGRKILPPVSVHSQNLSSTQNSNVKQSPIVGSYTKQIKASIANKKSVQAFDVTHLWNEINQDIPQNLIGQGYEVVLVIDKWVEVNIQIIYQKAQYLHSFYPYYLFKRHDGNGNYCILPRIVFNTIQGEKNSPTYIDLTSIDIKLKKELSDILTKNLKNELISYTTKSKKIPIKKFTRPSKKNLNKIYDITSLSTSKNIADDGNSINHESVCLIIGKKNVSELFELIKRYFKNKNAKEFNKIVDLLCRLYFFGDKYYLVVPKKMLDEYTIEIEKVVFEGELRGPQLTLKNTYEFCFSDYITPIQLDFPLQKELFENTDLLELIEAAKNDIKNSNELKTKKIIENSLTSSFIIIENQAEYSSIYGESIVANVTTEMNASKINLSSNSSMQQSTVATSAPQPNVFIPGFNNTGVSPYSNSNPVSVNEFFENFFKNQEMQKNLERQELQARLKQFFDKQDVLDKKSRKDAQQQLSLLQKSQQQINSDNYSTQQYSNLPNVQTQLQTTQQFEAQRVSSVVPQLSKSKDFSHNAPRVEENKNLKDGKQEGDYHKLINQTNVTPSDSRISVYDVTDILNEVIGDATLHLNDNEHYLLVEQNWNVLELFIDKIYTSIKYDKKTSSHVYKPLMYAFNREGEIEKKYFFIVPLSYYKKYYGALEIDFQISDPLKDNALPYKLSQINRVKSLELKSMLEKSKNDESNHGIYLQVLTVLQFFKNLQGKKNEKLIFKYHVYDISTMHRELSQNSLQLDNDEKIYLIEGSESEISILYNSISGFINELSSRMNLKSLVGNHNFKPGNISRTVINSTTLGGSYLILPMWIYNHYIEKIKNEDRSKNYKKKKYFISENFSSIRKIDDVPEKKAELESVYNCECFLTRNKDRVFRNVINAVIKSNMELKNQINNIQNLIAISQNGITTNSNPSNFRSVTAPISEMQFESSPPLHLNKTSESLILPAYVQISSPLLKEVPAQTVQSALSSQDSPVDSDPFGLSTTKNADQNQMVDVIGPEFFSNQLGSDDLDPFGLNEPTVKIRNDEKIISYVENLVSESGASESESDYSPKTTVRSSLRLFTPQKSESLTDEDQFNKNKDEDEDANELSETTEIEVTSRSAKKSEASLFVNNEIVKPVGKSVSTVKAIDSMEIEQPIAPSNKRKKNNLEITKTKRKKLNAEEQKNNENSKVDTSNLNKKLKPVRKKGKETRKDEKKKELNVEEQKILEVRSDEYIAEYIEEFKNSSVGLTYSSANKVDEEADNEAHKLHLDSTYYIDFIFGAATLPEFQNPIDIQKTKSDNGDELLFKPVPNDVNVNNENVKDNFSLQLSLLKPYIESGIFSSRFFSMIFKLIPIAELTDKHLALINQIIDEEMKKFHQGVHKGKNGAYANNVNQIENSEKNNVNNFTVDFELFPSHIGFKSLVQPRKPANKKGEDAVLKYNKAKQAYDDFVQKSRQVSEFLYAKTIYADRYMNWQNKSHDMVATMEFYNKNLAFFNSHKNLSSRPLTKNPRLLKQTIMDRIISEFKNLKQKTTTHQSEQLTTESSKVELNSTEVATKFKP